MVVTERPSMVNRPGMETWFLAARAMTSSKTSVMLMSLTLLTVMYFSMNPSASRVSLVRSVFSEAAPMPMTAFTRASASCRSRALTAAWMRSMSLSVTWPIIPKSIQ